MKLKNNIREKISKNNFIELENLLIKYKPKDYKDMLIELAFDMDSLIIYTIICMLIIKQETSELHYLAATILSHPFSHIEGAYSGALYHTRKAINLSSDKKRCNETLLFFNNIPEKLVSDKEAKKIALEIIKYDPDNKTANKILNSKKNIE